MNVLQSLFGAPMPSVSAMELSEKLKNGRRLLVLDVRQPEEFRTGHILGAKLVPLGELAAWIRHPVTRQTVLEMLHDTPDVSQVIRLKPEG